MLIFTGDELLRGDVVNTNQAYLGERLLELGLFATHSLCVTDNRAAIGEAVGYALARQPAVIVICGGLGPTEDDLTREAIADALGLQLVFHPELLEQIAQRFGHYGLNMSESNRRQAYLPEGSSPIPFPGTAPGFWLEHGTTLLVALPGVPKELYTMWEQSVEPLLAARLSETQRVLVRRLQVAGIGEGKLADALKHLPFASSGVTLGTQAGVQGITIILRSRADAESKQAVSDLEQQIRQILGDKVYGDGRTDLAEVLGAELKKRGLTVVTAESCTGGLVAKRLTDVPGSSDYFLGGVVSYSNELKTRLLGVDPDLLSRYGAVSEQVARAMAEGAAARFGADCSIATTGIAGPGGGTPEKPVGLVYIATRVQHQTQVRRFVMFGDRADIRERTAQTALDLLRRQLREQLPTPATE